MRTILLLTAIAFAFTANSQTSQIILDELSAKAKTYETIDAEFSSHLVDKQSGIDSKQEGRVQVKGDKYALKIDSFEIFNDGDSYWVYDKSSNDCTIDYVEDLGDDAFNPSELFTIWENDFKHEMMGEMTLNSRAAYHIKLFPIDPTDKAFHTVMLYVDKAKMEVVKIEIKGREGDETTYDLNKFITNGAIQDSHFKFDESKYPGVRMSDNRI
ncbi:MAG: outer membrane lipoprotein carrier protein [Flavobacteriales bacterium]|jgi:outer membrane lipoprotein carrier protein